MKRLFWKIVNLQQTYEAFKKIGKRHKEACEELYFVNPEQAQAHWRLCIFWLEKSERVYGKLRELSGNLTKVLQAKYRGRDEHDTQRTPAGERSTSGKRGWEVRG